jgi:hypothetical protein
MARDVDTDLYLGRPCSLRILPRRMKTEAADTSEALSQFRRP